MNGCPTDRFTRFKGKADQVSGVRILHVVVRRRGLREVLVSMSGVLSDRDLAILRSLMKGEGAEGIAKSTGIPPTALGMEIAKLQLKGLIAEDGSLTSEGAKAAQG